MYIPLLAFHRVHGNHSSMFHYRSMVKNRTFVALDTITILSTRQLIANIDWLNLKFNLGIIDRR